MRDYRRPLCDTNMPGSGKTRAPAWVSYDEVAAPYERYCVRRGYELLARDLVLMLALPDGASVLDLGTGTGAAALFALSRCFRAVIVGRTHPFRCSASPRRKA